MDDRFMITPLDEETPPPTPRYCFNVKYVECLLHLITHSHIQHTSSHMESIPKIKRLKI